jgi:hypothetical protein
MNQNGWEAAVAGYFIIRTKTCIDMEIPGLQTWIVFYLISFVVLLWAAFLSAQGVMLWVSLLLVLIIIGVNFITVMNQIKMHTARRELQRNLTLGFKRGAESETKEGEEKHA